MNKLAVLAVALTCWSAVPGCERSKDDPGNGSAAAPGPGTSSPTETGAPGTLQVSGKGLDLYSVFDATGENKINFTRTGKPIEVPAGPCIVALNGIRKQQTVKPGERNRLVAPFYLGQVVFQELSQQSVPLFVSHLPLLIEQLVHQSLQFLSLSPQH